MVTLPAKMVSWLKQLNDSYRAGESGAEWYCLPMVDEETPANFATCREYLLKYLCYYEKGIVSKKKKIRFFVFAPTKSWKYVFDYTKKCVVKDGEVMIDISIKEYISKIKSGLKEFESKFRVFSQSIVEATEDPNVIYIELSSAYRLSPQIISIALGIVKSAWPYFSYMADPLKNIFNYIKKSKISIKNTFKDVKYEDYLKENYGEFNGIRSGIITWANEKNINLNVKPL